MTNHTCDYCAHVAAFDVGHCAGLPYIVIRDRRTGLLLCIAREHGEIQGGLKDRMKRMMKQHPFVNGGKKIECDESPHFAVKVVK